VASDELPWVDVSDLLIATGARNLTRSGDEFTFSCISDSHAHGDASPSAGMNARTTHWRCRSPACGLRGNAADYLVALKGYTRSQAFRVLQERYGGPEQSVEAGALLREIERIRAEHERGEETRVMLTEDEYLDCFAVHWPLGTSPDELPDPMAYVVRRGFSPEVLNSWLVGYDEVSGRITIPIHDEDGALVGIKGRAWWPDARPRYCAIGDVQGREPRYGFQTYQKARHVFGLHRAQAHSCVVVEGELNAVALAQMGVDAVAVAGSEFSDRQARLIGSRFAEVVVYFDDDEAGYVGATKVVEALRDWMPVYVVEGAQGDAADALDPAKDLSCDEVRFMVANARSWIQFVVG
jgi:DNA primase